MQVTTIEEARALVGRTFERDGEVRSVIDVEQFNWRGGVSAPGIGYMKDGAVRWLQKLDHFSEWLAGATEVPE